MIPRCDRRLIGQCYMLTSILNRVHSIHAASSYAAIDINHSRIYCSLTNRHLKLPTTKPILRTPRLSLSYPVLSQLSPPFSSSTATKSRYSSHVEQIRNNLQRFRYDKWGFVIYRCTYDDDVAWKCFLEILYERTRNALDREDGSDLKASLNLKIQDDKTNLNGATKDKIRTLFLTWLSSDEAKTEQSQLSKELRQELSTGRTTMLNRAPRYTYCLQVDAAALESVINKAPRPPEPDFDGIGYVNLIHAEWKKPDPATYDNEDNGLDPETDDPTDDGEPEVEGCKMEDVGWMKVSVYRLVPSLYSILQKSGGYYTVYTRPPQVWAR